MEFISLKNKRIWRKLVVLKKHYSKFYFHFWVKYLKIYFCIFYFIVIRTLEMRYLSNKFLSVPYIIDCRCNVVQQISGTYSLCLTETSCLLIVTLISFPQPLATTIPFDYMNVTISDNTSSIMQYLSLWPAYLSWHNILMAHPCYMLQNFPF